jgi:hypothetical protein
MFEDALPLPLFDRLASAVRAVGRERLKRNYTTTFWLPRDATPRNIAEECVFQLLSLLNPGESCIGMEWWLGRLAYGEKLRHHFDRDMTIHKESGQFVHPLFASAFCLNDFPTSPTVITNQIPSPDGTSKIPAKPTVKDVAPAVANHYTVFAGNLRHGVIPDRAARKRFESGDVPPEMRLTFLVNYWDRRPSPPVCLDYDGTIYSSLENY